MYFILFLFIVGERVTSRDVFLQKQNVWIVRNKKADMWMTSKTGELKLYKGFTDKTINRIITQYAAPDSHKEEETLRRRLMDIESQLQHAKRQFLEMMSIKGSGTREYGCMNMRHYTVRVKEWIVRQYKLCMTDRASGFAVITV